MTNVRTCKRVARHCKTSDDFLGPSKVETSQMASISHLKKVQSIWCPVHTHIRTMKAVNTRMKKPMHIMRAKLMKLTEYEKPKDLRPMAESCTVFLRSLEAKIDNPTQTFYAKMCRRSLESSKLVAVFHNEGMDAEDTIRLRRRLIKNNMDVKIWGMQVVQEAIHETKFQHFEDILHRFNLYVISEEPAVLELLKVAKRSGRIHLLGGMVEDQFMSPKQMREYSLLPSLELARGQLSGILNSSISRTHSLLQSNQQNLATNLQQLAKGKVNTDGKEETEIMMPSVYC